MAQSVPSPTPVSTPTPPHKTETVLYGLPPGATSRHQEALLLSDATPSLIEIVKALATQDGFHSFRVAVIDLTTPPDFARSVGGRK